MQVIEKDGFHGLRFYLKSPNDLHHSADDDDRSAITFWGLRTVKPLMEQVVKMLSEHQTKSGGEMPESVNEERNRLEADE